MFRFPADYPRFSGIIIRDEDYDDLQVGIEYRNKKKRDARNKEVERRQKAAAEAQNRRELTEKRAQLRAGELSSPALSAMLEACGVNEESLVGRAVKCELGIEAVENASSETQSDLDTAIEAVRTRAQELGKVLSATDLPPPDFEAAANEATLDPRAFLLTVNLLSDNAAHDSSAGAKASLASVVSGIAKRLVDDGAVEPTWRATLAARLTKPHALRLLAAEDAELEERVCAEAGDGSAFDIAAPFGVVYLRGTPDDDVQRACRKELIDAKFAELYVLCCICLPSLCSRFLS